MKKLLLLSLLALAALAYAEQQDVYVDDPEYQVEQPERDFSKRIVFEKYLWAEGVNPNARRLDRLMVKFFDEDTVRIRNGELVSLTGRDISFTKEFLGRHPEIKPRVIVYNKTEEEYAANLARVEKKSGRDLVDLFSFYCFEMTGAATDPRSLINEILRAPEVETAYFEPIPVDMTCQDLGNPTPNYRPNQTYHDPAPLGVDLDWVLAEHVDDVVNGPASRWTGIFERGMQTTHEDIANGVVATAGTPNSDNDHGTAVTGVLGGCDANGVGCLGFVADQQMRLYQRNSGSYGSVAEIYDLANGDLLAGELTNSSWGYLADPLPPGQSCPCNPDQNGLVNPEYDAAVKVSIEAGVADGIHYFLAAGNGCVNLDNATFGTVFRNSTDTGSNYVAAINSTGDHDASCFTNWGERCDLNAWGDGSFTLGYSDDGDPGFTPTSRDEWYTATFGGTSNASPTVAGCAGVVHNIYRNYYGTTISTSLMRGYLNDFGTSPGNVTPGNIGVMPNLQGILAPDMNPDQRTDWTSPLVPSNNTTSSGASCSLTVDLYPAPSNTYWNASIENDRPLGWATPAKYRIYIDDVWVVGWQESDDTLSPLERTYGVNVSVDTRGGRHFARLTADPLLEVDEWDENDNNWYGHYVWNGRQLGNGGLLTLTAPPIDFVTDQLSAGYTNPNCDGYDGSLFQNDGWWDIMMVMAETSTADYDARVYSESITSTNGFDTYEQQSSYTTFSDFVGVNANVLGQGVELLASVVNMDDETADYRVETGTSTILANPVIGRTDYGSYSLTSSELFDVWEFNATELVPYNIEVEVTGGSANVVISVFGPDDDYFGRSGYNVQANANGGGGSEMISCWTPAQTGWHAIVVHKHNYADWDETADFNLYLGKAGFDFVHTLGAGWSHQLVVRQAAGGQPAVLPATLTGNAANNYVNIMALNQGCGAAVALLDDRVYKDGPAVGTFANWNGAIVPGGSGFGSNRNIGTVTGGRHQIGNVIDILNEGPEWDETNNRHDEQFVWTPQVLANNTMVLSPNVAPNWRDGDASILFPDFNVDGFRFTGGGFWSGVGMMPNNSTDDVYNLFLYDPATSSTSGFGTRLVNSWTAGANTEWVLENGNQIASETFDVGVHNNTSWPTDTSQSTYRLSQSNRIQDLLVNHFYGPFPFPNTEIINVFDVTLTAGVAMPILLDNRGAGDLGFAIYDPSLLYGSRSTYTHLQNVNGDGLDESFTFVPTENGRHGFVVFKNDRSDLTGNPYALVIGSRIPATPDSLVIKWASDAPLSLELTWAAVTADIYGQPLTVDAYNLVYTYNLDAVYPVGWLNGGSTLDNTQVPIFPNEIQTGFKCVILAVDSDGLVLSETGPAGGVSLVGQRIEDIRAQLPNHNLLTPPVSLPAGK